MLLCTRAHVLFTLFVFVLRIHILCCVFVLFVFLRLVYPILPVSLDCSFLIAPSVFSKGFLFGLDYCFFFKN